jgi:hypothetical protein
VIQANDFPTTDDREGNILDLPEADCDVADLVGHSPRLL